MLRWQENSSKTQETDSKHKMWETVKGRIESWNYTSEYVVFSGNQLFSQKFMIGYS